MDYNPNASRYRRKPDPWYMTPPNDWVVGLGLFICVVATLVP